MNRREALQLSAAAIAAAGGMEPAEAQQAPAPATKPAADPEAAARVRALGSREVRVHDPSVIMPCNGEYWVFYTGLGVPCYRSKDLVKWEPGPRVFDKAPEWVAQAVPAHRGIHFWAPEILRLGDRFLLYYSVSTFGKNTSAIALATNLTLDPDEHSYKWTDEGIVVQSASADNFNAIDPAVTRDAEGGLWLAFGSFWSGIKLLELDTQTGKRKAPDSPLHSLAHAPAIEAAYIDRRGEHYYLIVNWGRCCRGVNSTYNMRVGRSTKITGPYLDRDGKDLLQGGGSLLLETDGPFIGPGHAGILEERGKAWLSMHFYDGSRRGASTLALRPLTWDADGWPVVGKELPA